VALAAAAAFQVVALAWIAAWQQRAALEVRRLNGTVVQAIEDLGSTQSASLDELRVSEPVEPIRHRGGPGGAGNLR
jgi:hypothetical protein